MQSVVWDEALKINGADPDFHRRDLWKLSRAAISPSGNLAVQTLHARSRRTNSTSIVLDATKLDPRGNGAVAASSAAWCWTATPTISSPKRSRSPSAPRNVVPGIDFTNDPLLQGRLFSYLDTQLKRLGGPNFHQIPINAPKCPFHNLQRDGHMQDGRPQGPGELRALKPRRGHEARIRRQRLPPLSQSGIREQLRVRPELFADHYTQARLFYSSQTEPEQNHIVAALVFELSKCLVPRVRIAVLSRLVHIDETLAKRVAAGLGVRDAIVPAEARVAAHDMAPSPALSILAKAKPSLEGRKVGCLVTDGCDGALVTRIEAAVKKAGAKFEIIAPKVGGVETDAGEPLPADHKIEGGPSVLFDAVVLLPSEEGAAELAMSAEAVNFLRDAYGHLKVIGYLPTAAPMLEKAGMGAETGGDRGLLSLAQKSAQDFVLAAADGRIWEREAKVRLVA